MNFVDSSYQTSGRRDREVKYSTRLVLKRLGNYNYKTSPIINHTIVLVREILGFWVTVRGLAPRGLLAMVPGGAGEPTLEIISTNSNL